MSEGLATRGYTSDQTGGGGGPTIPTLTIGVNLIDVVWAANVLLTVVGAASQNWLITNIIGQPVTVLTATQTNATTIRLTTTDQTFGGSYILAIPAAAVDSDPTGFPNAFFSLSFVGDGNLPSLTSAVPLSPHTVEAIFSEPVVAAEALVFSNYSFDNGLMAVSVAQVSAAIFVVTTTEMHPATIYTMSVSGIHDLVGNPVT